MLNELTCASTRGDLPLVSQLLVDEIDEPHSRHPYLRLSRPLEAAFEYERLHVAKYLLAHGIQISWHVVLCAGELGSIGALELLLDYGWRPADWSINHFIML